MSDNLDLFGTDEAIEPTETKPAKPAKSAKPKGPTKAETKAMLEKEKRELDAIDQETIPAPDYGLLDIPVPIEHRPRYVVRDNWSKTYGRAGVWYHGYKVGVDSLELIDIFICTPLHVTAITRDDNHHNFGRLLNLRDSLGKWKEWPMPMNLLAADGAELRGMLLDMGVEIDMDAKSALLRYIQSQHPKRQVLAATKLGWHGDGYLMPAKFFAPADNEMDAVLQDGTLHSSNLFTKAGALATWTDSVAALATGNPLLILTLSSAFAAPLLKESRANNGGFHISGETSTGKSTVNNAAASVWGNPEKGRQVKTWRATGNGLEGAAALANDGLLVLDEIGELSDPKELGNIIYFLGNGSAKCRGQKIGGLREPATFRLLFLSNGEVDKRAVFDAAKTRAQAGMDVRMVEMTAARRYGAFDNLHGFNDGAALANAINDACGKCYGVAGPAFLQNLINDTARNIDARHKEILKGFEAEAGAQGRVAALFALVALGGELATEYGLTGWQTGTAIDAAKTLFNEWRKHRPSGSQEAPAMLEAVQTFIDKHGGSRFENRNGDALQNTPIIRERAGWYEDTAEGRVYHFTKSGLKEALDGFDFGRGVEALEAAGWLSGKDKEYLASGKQMWIGGGNYRIFSILPRDNKKPLLELLGLLEPCSERDLEPNRNLTATVRTVRNCEEASGLTENLTVLTEEKSELLEIKTLANQYPNSSNSPNSKKIDGGTENTFFKDGDYEEF